MMLIQQQWSITLVIGLVAGGICLLAGCASTEVVMGGGKAWDLQNSSWTAVKVTSSSHEQSRAGVKCLELGEYDEAIKCFEAALAADPDDHRSEFGIGVAYELTGRKQQAVEHYGAAVQLDPTESKYRRQLIRVKQETKSEHIDVTE